MTVVNHITIRCTDCGHTTDTADRSMVGDLCVFFGPGTDDAGMFDGCAGTYRRVWTAPGVKFSGPGFHSNDY